MTGTDKKWFTFTNGTHVDSLSPETYNRLYDFLELYVAREAPITKSALIQASAPAVFQAIFGIDGMTLPPDPIQLQPTYDLAKAAFEAQPPIRVLFDNGAGNSNAGWPYPGFERSFSSFPIPGTTARSWYFAPGGALANQPAARHRGGRVHLGRPCPAADRLLRRHRRGRGRPVDRDAELPVDPGSRPQRRGLRDRAAQRRHDRGGRRRVDVWVRSSTPNVDLQATISEVRPDGKETFVQNGWVRGNDAQARRRPRARCSSPSSASASRTSRRCLATASWRSRSPSTTRGTCIARARASA